MRYSLAIIALILVAGCDAEPKTMTNADIVRETEFCKRNGMAANLYANAWGKAPIRVVCVPKNE